MTASDAKCVLRSGAARDFSNLIADICGQDLQSLPYLSAISLFSDPEIQRHLHLPETDHHRLVIHDYQSVDLHAPLPLNTALSTKIERCEKGETHELGVTFSADGTLCQKLSLALRSVSKDALRNLKPTNAPDFEVVGDLARADFAPISQVQIDTYLHISGDRNPIHNSRDHAVDLGLENTVVPGLLLLSTCQSVVESAKLNVAALRCRFVAPLLTSQAYSIALQSRGTRRARVHFANNTHHLIAMADLRLG